MAKDLDKWQTRLKDENSTSSEVLAKIDKSLDCLSWAIFALNSFTLLSLPKAEVLDIPNRSKPPSNHDATFQPTWIPYPRHRDVRWTFHADCHFEAFLSLAESACREEAWFTDRGNTWSAESTDRFNRTYEELRKWPETLPSCVKLSSITLPHTIALQ